MPRTSSVSEKVWAQAIHAVTVQKMSLRRAAQLYGVHHMSLHRRVRGRYVGPATARFADEFQLSRAEEHEAVSVLREQFEHERRVSADDVRYVVRTIACHGARHDVPADFPQSRWIANFRRQHGFNSTSSHISHGSGANSGTVSQPQSHVQPEPESHLARTDSNVSARTDSSSTSNDSNSSESSGMHTNGHARGTASRDLRDLRDLSHAASLTHRDNSSTQMMHMRRSASQRSNSSSCSADFTASHSNNSSNNTAQSAPRTMFVPRAFPLASQLQPTPHHLHESAHRASTPFERFSRPRSSGGRSKGDDQRTDTSESESESSRHLASTSQTNRHTAASVRSIASSIVSGNTDDIDAKASAAQQHVAAADVPAETWERAMDAVEIHGMSLRNAAKAYGVHFAALHRRVKKRALLQQSAPPLENYVPFEDEAGIVRVVHARADLGLLMSYDELIELLQRTALKHAPTLSIESSYALVRRFQSRVEQSIRHLVTDWPLPRLESLSHFHAPPAVVRGDDANASPRDSVHSTAGGRSDSATMRTMVTPAGGFTSDPAALMASAFRSSSSSRLDAREHDFPSDDAHTPRPRLSGVPFMRPLYRTNSNDNGSHTTTNSNDVHMSSPNVILRL